MDRESKELGARAAGYSLGRAAVSTVLLSAYSWLIMHVARTQIAPHFAYQGYTDRDWVSAEVIRAIVMTVLLGLLLSKRSERVGMFALLFLAATVAVPLLWVPVFYGPLNGAGLLQLHLLTTVCFGVLFGFVILPTNPIRILRLPDSIFQSIILISVAAILAVLVIFYGLRPALFSLDEVYDQRDSYNQNIGTLGRYMVGALTNALLPVLLVWGYAKRRVGVIALAILSFALTYAMTGFKSIIVGALLTVVAMFVTRKWPNVPQNWLMALGGAVLLGYLADRVWSTFVFSSYLTRRAITTSGINTAYYIDLFSRVEFYRLRHSFLQFLGDPPHGVPPARLVGEVYYGSESMAANANFIADGFANFGPIGALGTSAVAGLCLWIYGRLTCHLPVSVAVPATIFILVAWANTSVFTTLLTHGGLLLALLMAIMPEPRSADCAGSELHQQPEIAGKVPPGEIRG